MVGKVEKHRLTKGFSLVEAMVAAGIFAAVILSVGQLVVSFLDAMRDADEMAQVMSRAEDYLVRTFVIPFGGVADEAATNDEAADIFDNDLDGLYANASLHSLINRGGGVYDFDTVEDPSGTHPFAYVVGGPWQIEVTHDIDGDGEVGSNSLEQSNTILRVRVFFVDFSASESLVSGVRYGG
ncbi:MAG: type II secretion system protein [Planctomycetota bacterium]|nr:type II secretion system protein [Planctomycetota bacterium]